MEDDETPGGGHGLGLLQRARRQGVTVLSAQQHDHERRQVPGRPGGEADPLDELPQGRQVPSGRGPLPQGEEGDDLPCHSALLCDGLAWELAGSQPDREPVVYHEEEAEGGPQAQQHGRLDVPHQADLGQGGVQGAVQEACQVHALPDQAVH